MTTILVSLTWFVIVVTTAWIALAVHYHHRRPWLRLVISVLPPTIVGVSLWLLPLFPGAVVVWLGLLIATVAWWLSLSPQADRDWAVGMEVLPEVEVVGDTLRIRNFRNFDYSPSGDSVPRYEERTFDLAQLKSLDYCLSHWSGRFMAHTLVSFGFDDGRFLAVSVEARRRRWQRYSPLWGLFRAYELFFVLGDERDVVRLRTNIRRERVYMHRVRLPAENLRRLLDDYLQHIKAVAVRPEWYNSVTSNCTTNLFYHRIRQIPWWMIPGIFLNGLSARILYRLGFLDDRLPFKELQARSAIRERALAAGDAADFSSRIRADMA